MEMADRWHTPPWVIEKGLTLQWLKRFRVYKEETPRSKGQK